MRNRVRRLSCFALFWAVVATLVAGTPSVAQESVGQIAFAGHGAFFDRTGTRIVPTAKVIGEAIAAGLFGPLPVPAETRARLGDILVLPHIGHFVWWREGTLIQNRLKGHHGGLSRAEAVTVLGVLDVS